MEKFERRLQLKYHFYISESYGQKINKEQIRPRKIFGTIPSSFQPKTKNETITKFTDKLKQKIIYRNNQPIKCNVSEAEKAAIKTLRDRPIVIRPADKNAGICIIKESDYIKGCELLLKSSDYQEVDEINLSNIKLKSDNLLLKYYENGTITQKEYEFSTEFETKVPKFYGNPKVHKANIPYRPIVSQIDGPTSRLNMLVDYLLTNTERKVEFLIKDTLEFLQIIIGKTIPEDSILVTLDVASLYTRIPWDEGTKIVCDEVMEHDKNIDPKLLSETIAFILENNYFQINHRYFKQEEGVAMGSRLAVKYANIYMGKKFKITLTKTKYQPWFYLRLIDDIFMIWTHGYEALKEFHQDINRYDKNIQYELNYNKEKITFLDTTVYIKNNSLYTQNYIKPTNKQMYLYATSNHPKHCIQSLPYSQALRMRRNTSNDEELKICIKQLKETFINRGYNRQKLDKSLAKIYNISQTKLLEHKTKNEKIRIPLILPYQPALVGLDKEIKRLWEKYILTKPDLHFLYTDYPMIGYSIMNTIGSYITSSLYPPNWKNKDRKNVRAIDYIIQNHLP